jgi:preprotein translocase subunit SecE
MEFLRRVQQFLREVAAEFRRVSWPSRQDVANSTVVVLALTVAVGLFLFVVDIGLSKVVECILEPRQCVPRWWR